MSPFHAAAIAFLALVLPCAAACLRGPWLDRIIGLAAASSLVITALVLLSVAFDRSAFLDLPLALALLTFGSGLAFVRFEEKAE